MILNKLYLSFNIHQCYSSELKPLFCDTLIKEKLMKLFSSVVKIRSIKIERYDEQIIIKDNFNIMPNKSIAKFQRFTPSL